jgi:hypothetical protein
MATSSIAGIFLKTKLFNIFDDAARRAAFFQQDSHLQEAFAKL